MKGAANLMDATLKRIIARLNAFWKKLSAKGKVLIIGGSIVAVVLIVLANYLITATKYDLLFTGLSDSEAGKIVTQLKTMGVQYNVNGSSIYVDKSKADETRMNLAESGYPQSTLTYATYMSGTSWAMTDGDKKQLALYQLQDRLQDTIKTIPGVTGVEVNIVADNNSTYVLSSDKTTVTASVKLSLNSALSLTKKQVQGIVLLVSNSVPDLNKDNVTVLDSDGTPLTNNTGDISGASSDQLELQTTVENEIKQKILSLLNPVYGAGNIQVGTTAVLDFSQKTTNTTTYVGSNSGVGVPSTQSSAVTITGANGTTASGTAGVNGGLPTYTTSSGTSTTGVVTQSNQETSYLYNTVNQQVQSQGGELKTLTIGVMLNNKNQTVAAANINDIKQTLSNAVGTPIGNISVQLTSFAVPPKASSAPIKAGSSVFSLNSFMAYGIAVLIILMLIITILIMLFSRKKAKKAMILSAVAEEQAEIHASERLSVNLPSIEDTIENSSKNAMKKQIENFTDKKPELVAQLLKNWLKD